MDRTDYILMAAGAQASNRPTMKPIADDGASGYGAAGDQSPLGNDF